MATNIPRSLFLVLCASSAGAFAQAPAPAAETQQPAQKRSRAISDEASSALSAGFRYQPPPPVAPEDDEVDLREIDKPRNEIIRLPKYVVEGERPPVFAERNLYTKEDLAKLAMQRYLGGGLNKYQLGTAGREYAMQMYWDEQRFQNMMDSERDVSLYRIGGDEARAAKAEKENKSMFLRVNDAKSQEMSEAAGQRY